MLEVKGDIFQLIQTREYDAYCVTTNGFVKNNGACVMGAGIAKTVRDKYKHIDRHLGRLIKKYGNNVMPLHKDGNLDVKIFSFPVKHNWWEDADIELIKRSCQQLEDWIDRVNFEYGQDIQKVLLPRPGCGNGKLKWPDVKPEIEAILSDRVYVATF